MGEVYAAEDSRLGRRVALKILPRERTSDPERVARFEREARASSTINHPSIVSIHDAGDSADGAVCLAFVSLARLRIPVNDDLAKKNATANLHVVDPRFCSWRRGSLGPRQGGNA